MFLNSTTVKQQTCCITHNKGRNKPSRDGYSVHAEDEWFFFFPFCPLHERNQSRHMCFWYFVINLLPKETDTCTMGLTGGSGEIWAFVIERDAASWEIYGAQLCPIYTKSISDKATASRATRKRKQKFMWGKWVFRDTGQPWSAAVSPRLLLLQELVSFLIPAALRSQVKNV